MYIDNIKKNLRNNNPIKSLADLSNISQSIAAIVTVGGILFAGFQYYTQQKKHNNAEKQQQQKTLTTRAEGRKNS